MKEIVKIIGVGFYFGCKVILMFWFVVVNMGVIYCRIDVNFFVDFFVDFEFVCDIMLCIVLVND